MPTLNAEKAIYKPCLFYYVLENCLLYKKSLNKIFKKKLSHKNARSMPKTSKKSDKETDAFCFKKNSCRYFHRTKA